MKKPKPNISPSCPKKLITALHRAKGVDGRGWNFSVLAALLSTPQLKVNRGTIHKLVTKGIQPRDEALRLALFLPRHPHKPRPPSTVHRQPLPASRKWWNKQPKEFKDSVIENEYLKADR